METRLLLNFYFNGTHMINTEESNWMCLYLYVEPPFENILINCLDLIAKDLIRKREVNKWFFIRYHENGMHIRFRLFFTNTISKQSFYPYIVERIEHFIMQNN